MKEKARKIMRKPIKIDLWNCEDLRTLINEQIRAEVKDVNIASRLEHLLADEVAYGTGGSGGVATA